MTTSYEARKAQEAAIKAQAASKGLEIFFSANTGYVRGSSYDTVILVYGNTYPIKDTLKANGAVWSGRSKCWVFANEGAFTTALAAI